MFFQLYVLVYDINLVDHTRIEFKENISQHHQCCFINILCVLEDNVKRLSYCRPKLAMGQTCWKTLCKTST